MATLSFNMVNANIPSVYNEIDEYSRIFDVEDSKIAYLEIGKKYYTIKHNRPMAFKATALVFYHKSANYMVSYADGTKEMLSATLICEPKYFGYSKYYVVFENKEALEAFMQTHDKSLLYYTKVPISLYIGQYRCDLRPYYFKDKITTLVGKLGYYIAFDLSVKANTFAFKYLWIDKDGLHYEIYGRERYNPSGIHNLYETEEECLKSREIVEFDDETEDEQEYVTLNLRLKIKKEAAQEIMQGLLEQKWIQIDSETDFYKEFK